MSKIKLLFASSFEPISSDYSNPLRYYLNITQSTEQGIRIIAVTDTEYYSENTVINISNSSNKLQLAPDNNGSPGTYQAAGTSLSLGTVNSTYTYFWAKSIPVVGDTIENDTTISIEISGEIFAEYNPPEEAWANYMLDSYKTLNPEQADWLENNPDGGFVETTFHNRFKIGTYLYNTFGPNGQNKTVCDFVLLFVSEANELTPQTVTNTGATLRWDVDGNVHITDNAPDIALSNGIITVSSTDDWVGVEEFRLHQNQLIGSPPRFIGFNPKSINLGDNSLTETMPPYEFTNGRGLYFFNNQFTGDAPVITMLNQDYSIQLQNNGFTTFLNLLQAIYNNRSNYTSSYLRLNISNNIEPSPIGKTPQQAYTDGDIGTEKYLIHVLTTDPFSEGFQTWSITHDQTPIVEHTITFDVKDDLSAAVENAQVTVIGHGSAMTNSSGIATIDLQNGPYSYTIEKTGKISDTGNFNVSGSAITINSVLQPEGMGELVTDYYLPPIPSMSDFVNKVYFDPLASVGGDGSIEAPYQHPNLEYANGVPSNTALLLRRDRTHTHIGRTWGSGGERHVNMIYNNNYIGAYGDGARPEVDGIWVASNSDGLTIRDLYVYYQSKNISESNDICVQLYNGDGSNPANVNIAYNIIKGKYTSGLNYGNYGPYPHPRMAIRGGTGNIVIFNNDMGDFGDNGIYVFAKNMRIIRNYIYNINRIWWGTGTTAEQTNPGGHPTGGDGMMVLYPNDLILAGNWVEPGRDYFNEHPSIADNYDFWKHTILLKYAYGEPLIQGLVEYNTMIDKPFGNDSGPNHYIESHPNAECARNIIAPIPGRNGRRCIAGSKIGEFMDNTNPPLGIYDNYFVRPTANSGGSPIYPDRTDEQIEGVSDHQKIFETWDEMQSYRSTNPKWGSDMDNPQTDLWEYYTPDS